MSVTVTLPDDLAARLAEEAERRHVTPDEVVASLIVEHVPTQPEASEEARSALEAFIGCGASTDGRRAADVEDWLRERFSR